MERIFRFKYLISIVFILLCFSIVGYTNSQKTDLEFTASEKDWIKNNREVVFSIAPSFPPFDFIDYKTKKHSGIVSEYISVLEKITGLKFILMPTKSWHETLESVKKKDVSMVTSIHKNDKRSEFLDFTSPFMTIKYTFIVRWDGNIKLSVNDLTNETLILVKDYGVNTYIKQKYPNLNYIYVDNILDGLRLLSIGRGDAIVANVPVVLYYKSRNMIGDLKIAHEIEKDFPVSFATRKDLPILASILDKAVKSIPQDTKTSIKNRWIKLDYKKIWESGVFWIISLSSIIIISFLLFLLILWRQKAHELERARQEAEAAKKKAEDVDIAKSKFFANMTHEIRTPMNSVLGFAEFLKDEVKSSRGKGYIDNITKSGQSLLKLIDDILDMSKIDAGKLSIQNNRVDLKKVLNEIKETFMSFIKEKDLNFFVDIDKDIPDGVLMDELRLRQIFTNLIGNAVKFTSHGFVKIGLSKKIRRSHNNMVDIIFVVEDSGIGVPCEDQEFIFNSFTQQKNQSSYIYGGTGLGLSITKNLVEMMNGEISLKSSAGQGSIFTIIFHDIIIVDSNSSLFVKEQERPKNIKFLKETEILIADDVSVNREFLIEYLKPHGFRLFEVETGKEVINFLKKRTPDIILLDMKMPELDGYDVLEYLDETKLMQKVRVIVITASTFGLDELGIRSRGVSGFIRKPAVPQDLLRELMKIIPYTSYDSLEDDNSIERTSDEYIKKDQLLEMYGGNLFDYKDFCLLFDGLIMDKWFEAENSFIITDITDFADELIKGGQKYNARFFIKLGEDIKEYASDFDMEKLKPLMQLFPDLLKKVKKMYKEE